MPDAILYEHDDGRWAVNPVTTGDPGWHRVGPVDVSALASAPAAEPVAWVRRHPDNTLTSELLPDAAIEPARKRSGAWVPLYAGSNLDGGTLMSSWNGEGWRKEIADTDVLLTSLGLTPDDCRTDGGWLNLPRIRALLEAQDSDPQAQRAVTEQEAGVFDAALRRSGKLVSGVSGPAYQEGLRAGRHLRLNFALRLTELAAANPEGIPPQEVDALVSEFMKCELPEPTIMFPNVDGACNCVLYPNGETKPCAVCDPRPVGFVRAMDLPVPKEKGALIFSTSDADWNIPVYAGPVPPPEQPHGKEGT